MNKDTLKGQWNQLKGDVKQKWGKLTDDNITEAEGDYDTLVGKIQELYGESREEVERQVDEWLDGRK